jgi:hypothetical protein
MQITPRHTTIQYIMAATKKESLRRRRGREQTEESTTNTNSSSKDERTKSTGTKSSRANASDHSLSPSKDDAGSSSLYVFKRHPLTYLIVLVGFPYFLYVAYRWIRLQQPQLVPTSFLGMNHKMRPAVGLQDARQVLILGSMSSGTSSIAQQLSASSVVREVGHEDSDTAWKFVRDGTVSWFHGIRYWPSPSSSSGNKTEALMMRDRHISQLCKVQWMFRQENRGLGDNYGFGPTLFGTPEYNCSWWQQAPSIPSSCYRHACEHALQRELACMTSSSVSSCVPKFQTTLLQTREPWKIVASLTAKYCYGDGGGGSNSIITDKLPPTLHWLFLALQVTSPKQSLHCVDQLVDYVTTYYTNILQAAPDIPRYRIEDIRPSSTTSICRVLQLAGLDRLETTVYPPNHERYRKYCLENHNKDDDDDDDKDAKNAVNAINKGRVQWQDLLEYATDYSIDKMKRLYRDLGYEYPSSSTTV